MKIFRFSMIVLLACLLYAPIASAQNGAFIFRGESETGRVEWNGESVVAVFSSDSNWYCGDELDVVPFDQMGVIRPDGSIKGLEKGHIFARAYYPATIDDFWADVCGFIENGPLVAEGIAHFTGNDNDVNLGHPQRVNTFGYTLNGALYDIGGFCTDGMVNLHVVRKFRIKKNCESDCFVEQVIKGPQMSCAD